MIFYIDVILGFVGDMFVVLLIDCGVDFEYIKLNILFLKFDVEFLVEEKFVNGIKVKRFIVNIYLYDYEYYSDSIYYYRIFKDIKKMFLESFLLEVVKEMLIKIFEKIVLVEVKVYSKNLEDIFFYEVGVDDLIVDIVVFFFCIDYLKFEKIIFLFFCDGRGFIKLMYGIIFVLVLVVLEIVR